MGNHLFSLIKTKYAIPFIVVTALVHSAETFAAKLDMDIGVNSELIWTDNVDIAAVERNSDTYLAVNPYIRIKRDNSRISADLDYQIKATAYTQYSGRNDLQHLFRSNLGIEIYRDYFFTDIYIASESEVIDASKAISFDGLSYDTNTTDKYTAKVSPRGVVPVIGDIGIDFSSSHGKTIYDQDLNDIEEHSAFVSLGTASRGTSFNWGINANKEYSLEETQNPTEYEQLDFSFSYPIFNRALFSAKYGEKREVLSSETDRSWDKGEIWNASLAYAISAKTRIECGNGKDLHGDTFKFSLAHETPRSKISLGYDESQITQLIKDIPFKFNRFVDVYVQKQSSVNWKLTGVKNTVSLDLKRDERYYRNIDAEEVLMSANVRWEHKLSGRSNIIGVINWWRLGDDEIDRIDDMVLYSLKYDRKIGNKSNWYVGADAGIRDGVEAALEYKEFKFKLGAELSY